MGGSISLPPCRSGKMQQLDVVALVGHVQQPNPGGQHDSPGHILHPPMVLCCVGHIGYFNIFSKTIMYFNIMVKWFSLLEARVSDRGLLRNSYSLG
jgi:hypothetical protein